METPSGWKVQETRMVIQPCAIACGDKDGHCTRCGKPLTGRRTRWCSDECGKDYYKNHMWAMARPEALKRYQWRCAHCGAAPGLREADVWFIRFLRWWCPPEERPRAGESFIDWLDRTDQEERVQMWRETRRLQDKLVTSRNLEVNHIVPVLGKHSQTGCHHHQENLEAVCKPCHKSITNEQRSKGLFKKDGK